MALKGSESVKSIYVVGLRDAHALEKNSLQMMQRQVERLKNYPTVEAQLRKHIDETKLQQKRLEDILTALSEKESWLKDATLAFTGNISALSNMMAGDEILKNTFANASLENFEVASYTSLITMAEAYGDQSAVPLLQQTLKEEKAMAQWIVDNTREITLTYLQRREEDKTAGR